MVPLHRSGRNGAELQGILHQQTAHIANSFLLQAVLLKIPPIHLVSSPVPSLIARKGSQQSTEKEHMTLQLPPGSIAQFWHWPAVGPETNIEALCTTVFSSLK